MQRLNVAYNDGMKLLLKQPRWYSASQMFVSVGVHICSAIIRNLIYRHMCRKSVSENRIIQALAHTLILAQSGLHLDCGDLGAPVCRSQVKVADLLLIEMNCTIYVLLYFCKYCLFFTVLWTFHCVLINQSTSIHPSIHLHLYLFIHPSIYLFSLLTEQLLYEGILNNRIIYTVDTHHFSFFNSGAKSG